MLIATQRKSETNICHIMIRGINRQNIFVDDEDLDGVLLRQLSRLTGFTANKICKEIYVSLSQVSSQEYLFLGWL